HRAAGEADSSTQELAAWVERALFEHVVGPQQECLLDREAERLGGLQVDDQLELRRLLDREVGRLGPLENLVSVDGGTPEAFGDVWRVGHEAAGLRELPGPKDGRQLVLLRKVRDESSVSRRQRIEEHREGIWSLLLKHCERACQVVSVPHLHELE